MIEFERVKKLAEWNKLSLREVNNKANLGTNAIYKWKTSKPGAKALKAVASVLHTSVDYLSGITDNPDPFSKSQSQADLDDEDTIFTFRGRPIPPEEMKIIKRLLNSDNDD